MALSAFGVEDSRISKADGDDEPQYRSAGRNVATGLGAPFHGAIAGKPGKKLRATGNEAVGSFLGGIGGGALNIAARGRLPYAPTVGAVTGALAGGERNTRKGYLKPLKRRPATS